MNIKNITYTCSSAISSAKLAAALGSTLFLFGALASEAEAAPFICQRGDGLIVVRSVCKTESSNSKTKRG